MDYHEDCQLATMLCIYIHSIPLSQSWRPTNVHMCIHLQAFTCESSDCSFFVSAQGVLTRSPSCNAPACTGTLQLQSQGITQLDPDVFANLTSVTTMWVWSLWMPGIVRVCATTVVPTPALGLLLCVGNITCTHAHVFTNSLACKCHARTSIYMHSRTYDMI